MKAEDAKRLRELERENARLKRLVAEQALDRSPVHGIAVQRHLMLKEVAKGNF